MKLKNTTTLPDDQRSHVQALMEAKGIAQAAKFLGISRHAMERAAGGLTIHRGTAALLGLQLSARTAEGKNP